MKIAAIVEGDGEVDALPILLRRLADWRTQDRYPQPLKPIRVRRDRFLNREQEFSRHLQLAAKKCGEDGWILVLLDADDDCPAELGSKTLERARICGKQPILPQALRGMGQAVCSRKFQMIDTPIAYIVFNRPQHTEQTFAMLQSRARHAWSIAKDILERGGL
ncbi:MAG: hypothetical protein K9K30_16045 [Burkholderiaceae bacterium]|nr:hypothetical protein [Burkholderiaceae bacterium]